MNNEEIQEVQTDVQNQETQQNTTFTDEQFNQLYQIFDSYFYKKSEQSEDTTSQDNLDNQTIIIDKLDRVHEDIQYTNNLMYWGIVISLLIFFTCVAYKFLHQFI